MDQKVFFFDIDETLLSWETGEVPKSAVYALEELKRQGHLTFVNSGRMFCTVPEVIKNLPVSGFVCGCGVQILCGKEILLLKKLPTKRYKEIVKLIWECDGDIILEGEKDCYFPKKASRLKEMEKMRQFFVEKGWCNNKYIEENEDDCTKFCFYVDEKTDTEKIIENLSVDMNIMDRAGEFYEVCPKPYSKASGIDFILEHFGLERDAAYVFGDSSNDLSMFQAMEHAIAMGKHDPILEPYTEFVTKTVEEDGILFALKHYGIL